MNETCPDCDTEMLEADDMDCDKAKWVCPNCAPAFVVADATSDEEKDRYVSENDIEELVAAIDDDTSDLVQEQ